MNRCQKILTTDNIKVASKLGDFLSPDYLYIPVIAHSKIFVKNKDKVYKNQALLENKERLIASPISGQVVGTSLITIDNNQQVKGIIIENDFKELIRNKKPARKDITKLSSSEILELIKNFQITDNRNNNMLIKKIERLEGIDYLLVNGLENEPFVCNKAMILNNFENEILDTISCLAICFNLKETFITIKTNDSTNVSKYNNIIGMYPEISLKLMPDLYPIGDYKILEKYFMTLGVDNSKLLILDVEDILNIYNVLKRNRLGTEKIITITGNAVSDPKVIKVKIGTKLVDALKDFSIKHSTDLDYIADGVMKGNIINNINNYVISDKTKAIIINYKVDNQTSSCLNCGKCNEVCPMNLNPREKDISNRCLKCNLCAYFCPANLKLKQRGDNDEK